VAADSSAILKLEVPVIVVLGERQMSIHDVMALAPGGILEIPKNADAELELRVNNRTIGTGKAVKVGENFGLRLTSIGNAHSPANATKPKVEVRQESAELDAEALAEAMLAGQ
jgi:flagellar motor switch protein FliN/FliY